LVHLVDLDGARWGRTRPGLVARAVAASGRAEIQTSGGVRGVDDALGLVAAGAARVVIGTAAFLDGALPPYVDALGERLAVAVDVREGLVEVAGWSRSTGLSADEAAARCADAGVARVLCTAVARDGMLDGPDLALLERVRARFGGPVVAAGGVGSEDDLSALAGIGVEAAVVGRALLDGRLPLSLLAR
ncbi:MAG: phosphoribosylformimino-5-aminoimidazole carboxamide ribotide isomerase, partial [Gaiellaceae bacterium]|nr:phosphoribosylformimino-5-aminoimidazole carboxamide ribotide isomerase [Gaiellaceae bacterium]